jgi:sec-independent protein translocase protein TatB
MLDVGFSEILLTSAIALIVLGPERLPKVARQVGNWMGRARAMARQLSEQLEREVSAEELLKTQSKSSSGVNLPAPPSVMTPSDIASPATMPHTLSALPPVTAPTEKIPHPTSPAAMHAADTAAQVKVPHPTSAAAMHAADASPQAELFATDSASVSHLPDQSPAATDASTPSHE